MRIVKSDLHNHLKTRSEMSGLFNPVIDVIERKLGTGGVLGLINFEDNRYEEFIQQKGYERVDLSNAVYIPEKDVLVVKGQEVPTKQGHLLVLGLRKDISMKSGRTLEDTIKEANDNDGIIIADHPFYCEGIGSYLTENPELLQKFDGIEVHNSEAALRLPFLTPKNANKKAKKFFNSWRETYDLAEIYSSDGHSLREIGRDYTNIRMPLDYQSVESSEELIIALRNGLKASRHLPKGLHKNSRTDALIHIGALAGIVGLSKIGIKL